MTSAAEVSAAERALAEITQLRGPRHPEALCKRAELARHRADAGDRQGAIRDYEKLLPDLVRALGRASEGTLDIGVTGTAEPSDGADCLPRSVEDYEHRVQDLLNRLNATYSPLL